MPDTYTGPDYEPLPGPPLRDDDYSPAAIDADQADDLTTAQDTPTPTRRYTPVLGEITTALFTCPDCGALIWHAHRDTHDTWHTTAGQP